MTLVRGGSGPRGTVSDGGESKATRNAMDEKRQERRADVMFARMSAAS